LVLRVIIIITSLLVEHLGQLEMRPPESPQMKTPFLENFEHAGISTKAATWELFIRHRDGRLPRKTISGFTGRTGTECRHFRGSQTRAP
jgi:hypothetical protein